MLELIFQGFIEWIYGLIMECWEHFASVLLDLMELDFSYLQEHMPVIEEIAQIMVAIGWALLMGNLVFQAIKTMLSGIGFEGEDPKLLFARTFVFAFLLLASPQICRLCLNMTSEIIDIMKLPDASEIKFADESSFSGLDAAWLLVILCGIIVMFQSFKLILEMAERYLILAILTITAPLAFGTGGSRNTSDIFTGWCRMFGSMCLLMVMHVVFVKLLLSVLSYYPSGMDVLPWMVLVLSVVKVAKKADGILTRIGLNPAITGDPLGRTFPGALTYMVTRTVISNALRTIGKPNASHGGAPSPKVPNGGPGSPKSPSPAGISHSVSSGASSGAPAAATEIYAAQQHQTTATQEGMQQATASQTNTRSAQESSAKSSFMAGNIHSMQRNPARRSSVPPEMRKPSPDRRPPGIAGIGMQPHRQDMPPGETRRAHTTAGEPAIGSNISAATPPMTHGRPDEGRGSSPGTAGTGFSAQQTRRTSIPGTHGTQPDGAVHGTVPTKEPNSTVSKDSTDGKPMVSSPIGVGASGTGPGHDTSSTRFTQRERTASTTVNHSTSNAQVTEHSGTAGTSPAPREPSAVVPTGPATPSRPTRPAQPITSPPTSPVPPQSAAPIAPAPVQSAISRPGSSAPVRQEPTRPAPGTSSIRRENRGSYHGSAEKAQSKEQGPSNRPTSPVSHINVPPAQPTVKHKPSIAPSVQGQMQKSRPNKRRQGGQQHGKQR